MATTDEATAAHTLPDRVKLPLAFDAVKMVEELEAQNLHDFIYYDVLPLTMPSPKDLAEPVTDYADGSWADWNPSAALRESPYFTSVVQSFREITDVTLVRLLRLAPGAVVKEHTDPTLGIDVHKSVIRLTIPIVSSDTVQFFLNKELVPMKPGDCWYLRLSDPHSIINASDEVRVNMSIDMIPNQRVRSLISG